MAASPTTSGSTSSGSRVGDLQSGERAAELENVHGILVPGGFGERGTEGKIDVGADLPAQRNVPYLGICFGMQMAVIEAARQLAGIDGASSTEFGATQAPVVGLMTEWMQGDEIERRRANGDLGGTMRLGRLSGTSVRGEPRRRIYGSSQIVERHRHRYEVNMDYRPQLEAAGLRFSGYRPTARCRRSWRFRPIPGSSAFSFIRS